MRLFTAVIPPEHAMAELADAVGALRGRGGPAVDGLRWTQRQGWHFTLAFYGEVPDETVPELSERLERAAGRTAPFRLGLRGGGQFGPGRTLWAGADGEIPVLRRLAERSKAAGRRAGLDTGRHRTYNPHLTLASSRVQRDLDPCVAELEAFTGSEWTVEELALVRSRLPVSGVPGEQPKYTKVGGWPLTGAG
ncbi:RNA 2',3'-cyclic phosphodiesterase [Streptomyces sp. TS71-3]|uniref:RNA 2',3'-cyclic phosphodiesterase n=1 Tax=Streptomyces sp. TS71-3 TaxID=2733862 RepID=UPI001BB39ED7|nr:RNA 2',3'-cyclic phosphodiesterase [Streptomyces sp. TS71-3]